MATESDPTVRFSAQFILAMRRDCRVRPGARLLVACSGGSDSVALAVLASTCRSELGLASLGLAHLDHGLRPDSAADADHVRLLGAALGDLPTHVSRRAIPTGGGAGPEKAARRVRYAYLREVAEGRGYDLVATAHTLDDQGETVLLRALRGTGLGGLRGIPRRRPLGGSIDVVRPVLAFRRAGLRTYLESAAVRWRDDPTNEDGNVRARLRNAALPLLAEIVGRDPVVPLARLAENARAEPEAVVLARRFVIRCPDGVSLADGHERLPRGALARALGEIAGGLRDGHPLSRVESTRLLETLRAATPAEQVAGLSVVQGPSGGRIVRAVGAGDEAPSAHPVALPVPGRARVSWAGVEISAHGENELHLSPGDAEFVDRNALRGELHVRVAAEGERFVPLGGTVPRRVRSLLARHGVPAAARARYPVVCDGDGLVVLPGITLAHRVRVTDGSRDRVAIGARDL